MGRRHIPLLVITLLSAWYACAPSRAPNTTPVPSPQSPPPQERPVSIERIAPLTGFAPAYLYVLTRVPKHPDNRALCVGVALHGFVVRRSCEQMDGEAAATLYEARWREPLREAGDYTVFVELFRLALNPHATARRELSLLSAHGLTLVAP